MDKTLINIDNGFLKKESEIIYTSLLNFIGSNKENIRFQKHPLGFKYFKLGKISKTVEFRLHFWIDTNENQDDDLQIHDHSFNFESFVVYGSLENKKYITKTNVNSYGLLYDVKFRNEHSRLVLNSNNQSLELSKSEIIEAGNFYNLKSDELHQSINLNDSTISLLKIIKPKNKIARVFSPKELTELSNFKRTFLNENENVDLISKLTEKIQLGKSTVANNVYKK